MATFTVYGLRDPRDGEIRYVGCTKRALKARLAGHLTNAKLNPRTPKDRWVAELLAIGMRPETVVLKETNDEGSARRGERAWALKLHGRLLNKNYPTYTANTGGRLRLDTVPAAAEGSR